MRIPKPKRDGQPKEVAAFLHLPFEHRGEPHPGKVGDAEEILARRSAGEEIGPLNRVHDRTARDRFGLFGVAVAHAPGPAARTCYLIPQFQLAREPLPTRDMRSSPL